jgi:hypothetical protein
MPRVYLPFTVRAISTLSKGFRIKGAHTPTQKFRVLKRLQIVATKVKIFAKNNSIQQVQSMNSQILTLKRGSDFVFCPDRTLAKENLINPALIVYGDKRDTMQLNPNLCRPKWAFKALTGL